MPKALDQLVPLDLVPMHRVEVRAFTENECIISVEEHHHVVGIPAFTALRLLDRWQQLPEEAPPAQPLHEILAALGGLSPAGAPIADGLVKCVPIDSDSTSGPLISGDPALAAQIATATRGSAVAWDARAVVNRAYRTGELLVAIVRGPHDRDLVDLDRMCHDMRVDWLPVEVTRGRAWVGPLVTPGHGAGMEDLISRREAAAYDRRVHRVLRQPSLTGDRGPQLMPDHQLHAITTLIEDRGSLLDRAHLIGADGTATSHPVLPMPDTATAHRPHPVADLLDPLTGLVLRTRQIRHHESVPRTLVTRQCDVGDIRAVSRWANNVLCQGSAFTDEQSATHAALGESIERYCANILDTLPITFGSFDELTRRGVPALDPLSLVLYSDQQYAAPGFPFVPLTRQTRVHWVPGRRL